MVVCQFNVKHFSVLKAKNNAPVGAHRNGPKSSQVAFEQVQTITRKIKRLRRVGLIEAAKDVLDRVHEVGPDSAPIVAFVEPFQTSMLKASDKNIP